MNDWSTANYLLINSILTSDPLSFLTISRFLWKIDLPSEPDLFLTNSHESIGTNEQFL
jgi:hypothetical protein